MLSRAHRLHSPSDFRAVVRGGSRVGSRTLVVHLALAEDAQNPQDSSPRIGLIVSKAVGPAVVRNRVKRRLRHLCRPLLTALPAGSLVVLRALPPAATAPATELGADLTASLRRAQAKAKAKAREKARTEADPGVRAVQA